MSGLERFVAAQADTYDTALAELVAGRKRSHWMWFVFPQIAGLGLSPTAQYYAIADLDEARAYLAHPVLGPRLIACAAAVLDWGGRRSAVEMLGDIDAVKLRSCCTLFEAESGAAEFGAIGGANVFAACLEALFDGERDAATLRLIA